MKITQVRTWALRTPVERPFVMAQPGRIAVRSSTVVEVLTDEGISGFGEALCHAHEPPEIARAVIQSSLRGLLVGQDPLASAVLWESMYNRTKDFGMKGAVVAAISALDIALFDIAGKLTNLPVHQLLGGAFRTSVQPYATGFFRLEGGRYPELLIEEALRHRERGFDAMKVKIGFGVDDDVATTAAIRQAVGPGARLMADANHAYDAGTARRLVRQLDELGLFWIEEPISPEDIDGYAELRAMGPSLLIAAGEGEYTRHGFWPWVTRRAVDVLQPDVASGGGITGLRQVLHLALAAGLLLNPHVWGTAISLAASLHFIAAIPPLPISRGSYEPMLEYDQSAHPFRRELVREPFDVVRGRVAVPTGAGLGIEVDRSVLDRFAI